MKKIFKIIVIIIIVILVLVGGIFGYEKIKQIIRNNERRNSKNLMEYVKTHDYDYLNCNGTDCFDMRFEENKFICDIDYNDIINFQSYYFITKDNKIYDVSLDKQFSNNQNCKKVSLNVNIKSIKGKYVLDDNNKLYFLEQNQYSEITLREYGGWGTFSNMITDIINNDNIYNILYTGISSSDEEYAFVLKNDNNIYKLTYRGNYFNNAVVLDKEEIYKSLEEYGNLKYIAVGNNISYESGKTYSFDDPVITLIISDKGYYYLDELKTDKCIKYQDVKCKLVLKESEIYKKFSKDIKYVGEQYTILSDNSVISTRYLTYPLDKDLNK